MLPLKDHDGAEAASPDSGEETVVFTGDFFSKESDGHCYFHRDQFSDDNWNISSATVATVSALIPRSSMTRQRFQITRHRPSLRKKQKTGLYCRVHGDELVRFFCTDCFAVICRDCKLTSHERHAAVDLSTKSSEARELVFRVTDRSCHDLEPKLRQGLQEAENHRLRVQRKKATILQTLESRAEELKTAIDTSLDEAKRQLSQEADDTDKIVSHCIDTMTQELMCFLSLTEHAQREAESGSDAAVLDVASQLKQFYGDVNEHEYDVLFGYGAELADRADNQRHPAPSCKLTSFTKDDWRVNLQLEDGSTLRQCHRCSRQHDKHMDFCPSCSSPVTAVSERSHQPAHPGGNGKDQWVNIKQALCGKRRGKHVNNAGSRPDLATKESQSPTDVLTSIVLAIPRYLGHVTRSCQSQVADVDEGHGARAPLTGGVKQLCRRDTGQGSSSRVTRCVASLTDDISADISAIQSLLSGWQQKPRHF